MREQDFIAVGLRRREQLMLASAKLRGAAAAAASAAGLAVFAFVLAVLPPVQGAQVFAAAESVNSASVLA